MWIYLIKSCVLLCTCVFLVNAVRVKTSLGVLEGSYYFTSSGKQVFTYLGVPYAQPPVGNDRFTAPKPVKKWKGVKMAKKLDHLCVQFKAISNGEEGSEDCLYLNIYTRSTTKNEKLPVIVFFHGGAFTFGGAKFYSPHFLLENHDLVVVIVNYRLGLLGFLSTEDDIVPGNNGLKDQTMALRWVKDNIQAFGGDEKRVTIAGNSAGAASVHFHYLSPLSRGLFHQGISMSGSALMPWALTERPLMKARLLADAINCPEGSTETMVKCLKECSISHLVSKVSTIFRTWRANPFTSFGPVIEEARKGTFLDEHPYHILKKGEVFNGTWLVGLTTEEGLYPASEFIDREEVLKYLNEEWVNIAPLLLDFNYTVDSKKNEKVCEYIKRHYFGNEPISINNNKNIIKMVGDRLFNAGMGLSVRLQASMTSPVYMYMFGYRGRTSLSDLMTRTKQNFGVSHTDDLGYVLTPPDSHRAKRMYQQESDQAMIIAMSNMWGNFAKHGTPSPRPHVSWQRVLDSFKTGAINYLMIKSPYDMSMTTSTDLGDYKFWESLGLNENENFKYSKAINIDVGKYVNIICRYDKQCEKLFIDIGYS